MSKALKAAIEANDPEAVRLALKGIKDINRKLPGANKPLLYACEKGADKVLEVLFEAGAIAEKKNTFPGDTPIAMAAEHQQLKVLERLLALKQASDETIQHAIKYAAFEGREKTLEAMLRLASPTITIECFRLGASPKNAAIILGLLVKHGGNLRGRHEARDAKETTPLHELVGYGKIDVIKTLVKYGAEINARDSLGRTPLMILASSLEYIEGSKARAAFFQELKTAPGCTVTVIGDDPQILDGLKAVQTMLELGADATLVDNEGNDAIDHYQFEYQRCNKEPDLVIIQTLRKSGARGSKPTLDLFTAISKKDLVGTREAIKAGADINRLTPPPVPITPLSRVAWGGKDDSLPIVRLLLESGADPNKYDKHSTPLIRAARSGNLAIVKALIAGGADIHALELNDEFPDNAYSVVSYEKPEIANYLKSLGATKPKPVISKPLKPGVESWNDFSELLVKASVEQVAEVLAKIIGGKAHLNVYGQSFKPGQRAYAVVRPKGMNWCNVFRLMPPVLRYEDSNETEAFARELAKVSGASVLSVEYSDTSDAATIFRAEPDGKSTRDAGWDHDALEEMVGALGDKAPAWAKKQLAGSDEDDPTSTERLELLAAREKFVVAAFGLDCEPGREVEMDFTGYAADVFDGVAFVSS